VFVAPAAYEILELYLELLAVRSSLVANSKEIPRDMIEVGRRRSFCYVLPAHAAAAAFLRYCWGGMYKRGNVLCGVCHLQYDDWCCYHALLLPGLTWK
jgi:hypothetical protein